MFFTNNQEILYDKLKQIFTGGNIIKARNLITEILNYIHDTSEKDNMAKMILNTIYSKDKKISLNKFKQIDKKYKLDKILQEKEQEKEKISPFSKIKGNNNKYNNKTKMPLQYNKNNSRRDFF